MTLRPLNETLDSLRLTLQQLEQTADLAADAHTLAKIKRIILSRIADLEVLSALARSNEPHISESAGTGPITPQTSASDTIIPQTSSSENATAPEPGQVSDQNPSQHTRRFKAGFDSLPQARVTHLATILGNCRGTQQNLSQALGRKEIGLQQKA